MNNANNYLVLCMFRASSLVGNATYYATKQLTNCTHAT